MNRNNDNSGSNLRQENITVTTLYGVLHGRDAFATQCRPARPYVGPQAAFSLTAHDIGLCDGAPTIAFVEHDIEGNVDFQMGLEWVLRHLELFDEPSRHIILSATAVDFGMPLEAVMGGLL